MKTLEVIKDKATLTSAFEYIAISSYLSFYLRIKFDTYVYFKDILFNDSKEMYGFLKRFIYYLYGLTYNIKFVRGHNLLMEKIFFFFNSNERNNFNHEFDISFSGIDTCSIRKFNKTILKNYHEELINKGHFFYWFYKRIKYTDRNLLLR